VTSSTRDLSSRKCSGKAIALTGLNGYGSNRIRISVFCNSPGRRDRVKPGTISIFAVPAPRPCDLASFAPFLFDWCGLLHVGLRDGAGTGSNFRKGTFVYLPRVYARGAGAYRVRYAIANIMRDRVVNEGAFTNCFEMEDGDEVICAILRRSLKNQKLRTALERSHLVNLVQWLILHPEFSEAYYGSGGQPAERKVASLRSRRH
jgi:hypothetical protein